ncbi:uncharacterized protein LOC126997576 [Eriocheir sinensis]|uniref:uncharacterized protein LOC126997576 n=1 Tax=Eriocheir sinensis TaxID=95602 RepID=UPI0021C8DCF4|nr:uncharacterized protein LOC126997576 [Eriocheir sinensis]
MKRVLLLLALVVGAALAAEEPQEAVAEPEGEVEGKMMFGVSTLAVAKSFISVVWYGFSVAAQVVILIALVFLIVTLASAKTMLRQENSMDDYEYYQVPAYGHSGYDASNGGSGGGSSYASGYSKRSADFPSFLNMPVVQKLTERVHQAIEAYSAQN